MCTENLNGLVVLEHVLKYNWKDNQSLFCRKEQGYRPFNLSQSDSHHLVCNSCGYRLHGATLVVSYSTDEDRPASIALPRTEPKPWKQGE